jgi:hypothetical protein
VRGGAVKRGISLVAEIAIFRQRQNVRVLLGLN